jgi:hypothetical protein
MVKRHHKGDDGKYHISDHAYAKLIGSRAEVMHRTAYKTAGGLIKSHLKYNKHGKIVSKAKSAKGPQILKRLTSKGYFTRKGHFGVVKKSPKGSKTRKHKRTHKKHTKKRSKTHKKRGLFMHEKRGKHGRFRKL